MIKLTLVLRMSNINRHTYTQKNAHTHLNWFLEHARTNRADQLLVDVALKSGQLVSHFVPAAKQQRRRRRCCWWRWRYSSCPTVQLNDDLRNRRRAAETRPRRKGDDLADLAAHFTLCRQGKRSTPLRAQKGILVLALGKTTRYQEKKRKLNKEVYI